MSTLYLLQYNNYFNRTIKRESSISNYITGRTYRKIDDINFFYNDNVNTVQTINYNAPISTPETQFDYLLVDNNIYGLSRWFIIENKWNRKGQQILTLRRDLVVDFFNTYITQPLFAEKGCLSTYTSATIPIISNPENIQVSKILKSKTNLATSNRAIVGYIDRTYNGEVIALNTNAIYIKGWEDLGLEDVIGQTLVVASGTKIFRMYINDTPLANVNATGALYQVPLEGSTYTYALCDSPIQCRYYRTHNSDDTPKKTWAELNSIVAGFIKSGSTLTNLGEQLSSLAGTSTEKDTAKYKLAEQYFNTPIVLNNKIYKLSVSDNSYNESISLDSNVGAQIKNAISLTEYIGDKWSATAYVDENSAQLQHLVHRYVITAVEQTNAQVPRIQFTSIASRGHCGQPYDIFYMTDSDSHRQLAGIIASRLYSSGALYDIQLLPYAPDITSASNYTKQTVTFEGSSVDIYWMKKTNAVHTSTSYTKSYTTALDGKLGCLCDTVRICSPNHANSWDFNPAVNGGVTGWTIRMTFKPFTPYIHCKPNFNTDWMYGMAYDEDPRGLICGGSFSFPLVSDKWASYQINNKAYYDSFNRDIENLNTTQDAQRVNEIAQIAVGALQGGVTGAGIGNYLSGGNGVATGVGAVAGTALSLAGGIADYNMNEKLRNEAIDYRKDQFGFNSQNMIASPRTLARTDAFDIDWNGTIYIEFYSASDAEKENIKNKLKYNGWSINYGLSTSNTTLFTDGIKSLLNIAVNGQSSYVKGQLIYTTQYDDTHVFNELANEFYKGFYWQGGTIT